jgi:metal-sulfur cluster biosynthetic enzyme
LCLSIVNSTVAAVASVDDAKKDVLIALSQIIDPDFGTDIVSCGFVKGLEISEALEEVKAASSPD